MTPVMVDGVVWPTAGWPVSTPAEQGMDGDLLDKAVAAIRDEDPGFHSLLVIRHGYLVSETYFNNQTADQKHLLYSCTKSVIATLIGIAIEQGSIQGTGQLISDFFPGRTPANPELNKAGITLEDLLTMRSGLGWVEEDAQFSRLYQSADWVQYMLDLPMSSEPGSQFYYCSGCSHLMSAILKQATGMNPQDYAQEYLFGPLGIDDVIWEADPDGLSIGGWGIEMTPRNMAKLGYLYLNEGRWEGKQLVPASWIEQATRAATHAQGDLDYGYQWWIDAPLDGYAALGRNGQTIFVIPKQDLVIVTTADMADHSAVFSTIEDYIVPAVRSTQD